MVQINSDNPQSPLYERMFAEQEKYRKWLLAQPANVILEHAIEYAIREAIVMWAEDWNLPQMQEIQLLKSRTPVADVYKHWRNDQVGYLEGISDAFEKAADYQSRTRRTDRAER